MIPIGSTIVLSVIIPVYNVEKHLSACIDSLMKCESDAYEIILVDDGSPDGSPALCDEYEKRFDCIRVIHKQNGGAASARNEGARNARGSYLCFIDSDDYTDEGFIDSMIGYCTGDDIVCFPYYVDDEQTHSVRHNSIAEMQSRPAAEAVRELEQNGGLNMATNKLYRVEMLRQEPAVEFLLHTEPGEDLIFNCGCYLRAQTVTTVNHPYYHWVRRGEDTLANQFRRDLNEKNKMFIEYRCRLYEGLGIAESDAALLAKGNLGYVFSCIPNMYRKKCRFPRRERIALYKEILRSRDVARWVELAPADNSLMKQFKRLYGTHSAFLIDSYYSAVMWGRGTFDKLWQKIRKRMK